jgi:hypothetical protein
VCTEASSVLRAVVADFVFNCWCLGIHSDKILIPTVAFVDCRGNEFTRPLPSNDEQEYIYRYTDWREGFMVYK